MTDLSPRRFGVVILKTLRAMIYEATHWERGQLCGLIAQLVEHRTGIADWSLVRIPLKPRFFFSRLLLSSCLRPVQMVMIVDDI